MSAATPHQVREQMLKILGDSVYQALGLKECLLEERKALESQDSQALHTAVDNKQACVNRLQSMENQRASLGSSAGFEAGPDQMEQLAAWCDRESAIASCWQHLMQVATECNSLNMSNGAIIRVRKQQIESNLAVVRGGSSESDTYGRNGTDKGAQHQRSLAEA